jgi:hypothetical protein
VTVDRREKQQGDDGCGNRGAERSDRHETG